jgi:hypothetical protein
MSKPEFHNGEVWARTRNAARIAVGADPRSFGEIAHDAARDEVARAYHTHPMAMSNWASASPLQRAAWEAAAQAVRTALVGSAARARAFAAHCGPVTCF